MNYIFDIGNVLVFFRPKEFLQTLWDDEEVVDKVYQTIFCSEEWVMLDRGVITEEEATERFCINHPNEQNFIRQAMSRWHEMLLPDWETASLLQKLKEQGHKLYFLSNYQQKASDYILDRYPFFTVFDGGVFSWSVHMVKPDIQIYRCLLDSYKLAPQDCVFIDDMEQNVVAAENIGMKGIVFTSADYLWTVTGQTVCK